MWNHARKSADIRGAISREKIPPRSRIDAPGMVTPHAPSDSGAHSESFVIKIAPTECMRCDR